MLAVIYKYEDDTVKLFDLSKGRPSGVKLKNGLRPYDAYVFQFGSDEVTVEEKDIVFKNVKKKLCEFGQLTLEDGLEEKFAELV